MPLSPLNISKSPHRCQDKSKGLNYGPQSHLGNAPTHPCFLSSSYPDCSQYSQAPLALLLQNSSTRVLHKHTLQPSSTTPLPHLTCVTPTSTRSWIIPSYRESCPSPSMDLSPMEFCIFMIPTWFISSTLNKLHEDKNCVLFAFHPIHTQHSAGPEGSPRHHLRWMARPSAFKWAVHTGKHQKCEQNSYSYETFCSILKTLRRIT